MVLLPKDLKLFHVLSLKQSLYIMITCTESLEEHERDSLNKRVGEFFTLNEKERSSLYSTTCN